MSKIRPFLIFRILLVSRLVDSVINFSTCRVKVFNSEHILFVTASRPRWYLTSAPKMKLKRYLFSHAALLAELQKIHHQRHHWSQSQESHTSRKSVCTFLFSFCFRVTLCKMIHQSFLANKTFRPAQWSHREGVAWCRVWMHRFGHIALG